jgi:hypothetical protein
MKKLNGSAILFISCLMVFMASKQVSAGGQIEPEGPPPLAEKIIYMAWYEEQLIHVALANTSNAAQDLTVSIGTEDVGTYIQGSQKLEIPANCIRILEFPALKKKTARGDLKISDSFFIYSNTSAQSGHVGSGTIQNIGQKNPSAYLTDFVVGSNSKARFNYKIKADKSLKIVLIAKSIKGKNSSIMGRAKQGAYECAKERDIEKLNIPDFYKKEIESRMQDNFCFAVNPDTNITLSVDYKIPTIGNCEILNIPVRTYNFTPSGGLLSGGKAPAFMIYNPDWAKPETIKGDLESPTGCLSAPPE